MYVGALLPVGGAYKLVQGGRLMKLSEIKVEEVLSGKIWTLKGEGGAAGGEIEEALGFSADDMGLVSAIVKFADGSDHPALVVKSFPKGGDDVDIYIFSGKFGWLNIHTPGFMRAMGKYSHDIFPFDYFVSMPWKGGAQPEPDKTSSQPGRFKEAVERIKSQVMAAN